MQRKLVRKPSAQKSRQHTGFEVLGSFYVCEGESCYSLLDDLRLKQLLFQRFFFSPCLIEARLLFWLKASLFYFSASYTHGISSSLLLNLDHLMSLLYFVSVAEFQEGNVLTFKFYFLFQSEPQDPFLFLQQPQARHPHLWNLTEVGRPQPLRNLVKGAGKVLSGQRSRVHFSLPTSGHSQLLNYSSRGSKTLLGPPWVLTFVYLHTTIYTNT